MFRKRNGAGDPMSSGFSRSTSRVMHALTSRVWIWLVMAAAVGFTVRGVSLIVSADREQAEINSLVVLMSEINALEHALEEFERGITPQELLQGDRTEEEIWSDLVLQEQRQALRVGQANPGFPDVGRALADVEATVRRLGEIRRGVLDARSIGDGRKSTIALRSGAIPIFLIAEPL